MNKLHYFLSTMLVLFCEINSLCCCYDNTRIVENYQPINYTPELPIGVISKDGIVQSLDFSKFNTQSTFVQNLKNKITRALGKNIFQQSYTDNILEKSFGLPHLLYLMYNGKDSENRYLAEVKVPQDLLDSYMDKEKLEREEFSEDNENYIPVELSQQEFRHLANGNKISINKLQTNCNKKQKNILQKISKISYACFDPAFVDTYAIFNANTEKQMRKLREERKKNEQNHTNDDKEDKIEKEKDGILKRVALNLANSRSVRKAYVMPYIAAAADIYRASQMYAHKDNYYPQHPKNVTFVDKSILYDHDHDSYSQYNYNRNYPPKYPRNRYPTYKSNPYKYYQESSNRSRYTPRYHSDYNRTKPYYYPYYIPPKYNNSRNNYYHEKY